jgi:hypothetical protein
MYAIANMSVGAIDPATKSTVIFCCQTLWGTVLMERTLWLK